MNGHLLDVNVLLALGDPRHVHHEAAHAWFGAGPRAAWATCPITENAFVRIVSHPSYPTRPGDAVVVLEHLRDMCAVKGHLFWPDDATIRDAIPLGTALTHAQVTDVYLLALAVAHGGRLATFDRHVPTVAVVGGQGAIEIIPA